MAELKPAAKLSEEDMKPFNEERFITFKHPGYLDSFDQNLLLKLPAYDHVQGGLHNGLATVVCGIIACNTWDRYLTKERDCEKLESAENDLLMDDTYYYHVLTTRPDGQPYPIYPAFEHWSFPHDNLLIAHVPPTDKSKSRKSVGPVALSSFS